MILVTSLPSLTCHETQTSRGATHNKVDGKIMASRPNYPTTYV